MKYQKTTLSNLVKQRDEITSLFISGRYDKKFQNSELGKVLGKIDTTKKKYKELKEQMDKSRVDLSLLDELFMFNSILSGPTNIIEGIKKGELIENMVDKISLNHDRTNFLITMHFRREIGDKSYTK